MMFVHAAYNFIAGSMIAREAPKYRILRWDRDSKADSGNEPQQ